MKFPLALLLAITLTACMDTAAIQAKRNAARVSDCKQAGKLPVWGITSYEGWTVTGCEGQSGVAK